MNRYVILGTAGHIDHGKSALVKAMTGVDPDRLKEEKARGITIDLGFADLSFEDGLTIGIVDVPGHERLVKNMLAGAGGIDMVVMVIAADEGVMPQSREHLAICDLLGIERGLIVLTKSDLVEPDWLELVTDDVREFTAGTFLEGADIMPVSSKTGDNLDVLKKRIHDIAADVPAKSEKGIFRLPIDRVFTLKGFGTVITGTALSGRLSVDEPVEILPKAWKSRVRGLQSHGHSIGTARAGQRVAINLQGIEKDELSRGEILTVPDRLKSTSAIDARLRLLKDSPPVKSRSLVHFHAGTAETIARIILYDTEILKPGEEAFCQFRLQKPLVAMSRDRFVIRRFSPLATIGGGTVLDQTPHRRKRSEGVSDLEVFNSGSLQEAIEIKIRRQGIYGMTLPELEGWIRGNLPDIQKVAKAVVGDKGAAIEVAHHLVHNDSVTVFREKALACLKNFHKKHPMKDGMPKEELRSLFPGLSLKLFSGLLERLREVVIEQDRVRSAGFKVALSEAGEADKAKVLKLIQQGGLQPPFVKELAATLSMPDRVISDLLKLISNTGAIKRINDSLYISSHQYDEMMERLKVFFSKTSEMTVAQFRDLINATRKYALPYLEHLDAAKITLRTGDVRKFLLDKILDKRKD